MSFLKNLLGKKDQKIESYSDFWKWFQEHAGTFHKVVKNNGDIQRDFFEKLSPKLDELKEGYYYVTGMVDDSTAKLVITADGKIKNFVFVEELIAAAPAVAGWKFTAHKPSREGEKFAINMNDHVYEAENLNFYPNVHREYPDEIEVTVVHPDLNPDNKDDVSNGTFVFLDNYLGELNFATMVDYLNVVGSSGAMEELIPIEKLKHYLHWREKEFVEKYEGIRHGTENDRYTAFEADLDSGNPLVATINTDLLKWDNKCSHPWIMQIDLNYGDSGNNGLPDDATYSLMNEIEEKIDAELKDVDGYLNIGRQTAEGVREVYYACKDFRKSSKVVHEIIQQYRDQLAMDYDIHKDKYWRTFDRFNRA